MNHISAVLAPPPPSLSPQKPRFLVHMVAPSPHTPSLAPYMGGGDHARAEYVMQYLSAVGPDLYTIVQRNQSTIALISLPSHPVCSYSQTV